MKSIMIIIVMGLMSLNACKNDSEKSESIPSISKEEMIPNSDTEILKLNNGEKWEVNKETHEGFEKMRQLLKSFDTNNDKDYKQLGANLSEQTGSVIKNCTMKGESHDQLHVVLVPILNEVSDMKAPENNQQAKRAKDNVDTLIEKYFEYFKY